MVELGPCELPQVYPIVALFGQLQLAKKKETTSFKLYFTVVTGGKSSRRQWEKGHNCTGCQLGSQSQSPPDHCTRPGSGLQVVPSKKYGGLPGDVMGKQNGQKEHQKFTVAWTVEPVKQLNYIPSLFTKKPA